MHLVIDLVLADFIGIQMKTNLFSFHFGTYFKVCTFSLRPMTSFTHAHTFENIY